MGLEILTQPAQFNQSITLLSSFSASGGLSANNGYFAGNVGLNISNPAERFTVAGNISASGSINVSSSIINGTSQVVTLCATTLSARSITAIHGAANDGVNPSITIGEIDPTVAGGTVIRGFSGFALFYDELSNRLTLQSIFSAGNTLTAVQIDRFGNIGIDTQPTTLDAVTIVGSVSTTGPIYGPVAVNVQNGTVYTFADRDNGGTVASTNATTGLTASIIGNNYPVGYQTTIIQLSTGRVTVSAGSGVTLNQANGFLRTTKQYSAATLIYTGTLGGWILFGDVSA